MSIFKKIACALTKKSDKSDACNAKEMHEHKSEKQIDKTIDDSFPASDPPSHY